MYATFRPSRKLPLLAPRPNEPAEEGELPRATETHENLNPEVPQKTVESTTNA